MAYQSFWALALSALESDTANPVPDQTGTALESEKCIGCKQCEQICPMAVEVTKDCNNPECIPKH